MSNRLNSNTRYTTAAGLLGLVMCCVSHAATTDIATTPLATSNNAVKPNLMFTLDASGSMALDILPDFVDDDGNCKGTAASNSVACTAGEPPHYAADFNDVYYNPQVQYKRGVDYQGNNLPNQGSPWTAVLSDYYIGGNSTVNLVSGFTEVKYCNSNNVCKSNGSAVTGSSFTYNYAATRNGLPEVAPLANFSRSATTVTVTMPTYPHGLSNNDVVYVNTNQSAINGIFKVTVLTATTFKYTTSGSGNVSTTNRPFIPQPTGTGTGTFTRAAGNNVVTVTTSSPHGLTTGDLINTGPTATAPTALTISNALVTNAAVTVTGPNTFTYVSSATTAGSDANGLWVRTGLYTSASTITNTNAYYYTITPVEYCADSNLTTCVLSTAPTVQYCSDAALTTCTASTVPTGAFVFPKSYNFPALVRYCQNSTDQNSSLAITGSVSGAPRCEKKYVNGTNVLPRYGKFNRTDIVPATATYTNRPNRFDCASRPTCTYAEEMTNFANWYTYYRTRMQMMKTSAGQAFASLDDRYRIGFITISPGSPVASANYLAISDFTSTQKQSWYTKFYNQVPANSTPLRTALSRVGRYFAGVHNGINSGMADDPIQYSCQQNFTILTTDGYWNDTTNPLTISGSNLGNYDNVDSNASGSYSSRTLGTYDGALSGASATLADVAQYYYQTDLRPGPSIGALGLDVSLNNVPTSTKDNAPHQHMTTFTLGLVDGLMTFNPNYESASTGDFANIKQTTSNAGVCFWTTGRCDWPVPVANMPSALDDLWHAAVNGRGTYYQATNPTGLSTGLTRALNGLSVRLATAAASAVSNPIVTATDNGFFSTTYTTLEWYGEVIKRNINPVNGTVDPTIVWSAQTLLDARAQATTDNRVIYTFDDRVSANANKMRNFNATDLTATEQTNYFANKCTPLGTMTQCSTLVAADLTAANDGPNMINFLRGQNSLEATAYRDRLHVLGDTINGVPNFVRTSPYDYSDPVTPSYAQFKAANNTRQATLFVGANDGMLHAINADSGGEMWAYVPKMLFPKLYHLADQQYATGHTFYVDGGPESWEMYDGSAWRTILVGGLNSGGRGYYALDVTDPLNPKALWEFCNTSTMCAINDPDLGLTYGNPIITKRASDGKWVVLITSGYNNISPGTGKGYLYVLDPITGAILEKVNTGVGDTTTPSGLAKISAWADNGDEDNTTKYVYGADMLGNLWRFDLQVSPTGVLHMGNFKDATGRIQPVTTRPELAKVGNQRVVYVATGRFLGLSDLTDPATQVPPDLSLAWQQSFYAIKDADTDYGVIRNAGLVQQTITILSATQRSTTTHPVDWSSTNGWFVDFNASNQSPGERVNLDPLLIAGTLVLETNVPDNTACNAGGVSWQYQFNFQNGQFVSSSPNGVAGQLIGYSIAAGFAISQVDNGLVSNTNLITGAPITSPVRTAALPALGKRVGWREITY